MIDEIPASDGSIRIANFCPVTDVLGPGLRSVVWVQGCFAGCGGCIDHDMQKPDGGYEISVSSLSEMIVSGRETDGITVSGGEPFLQARGLCELLSAVKERRADIGVIVYSGFTYEQLMSSDSEYVHRLLSEHTDTLIDGRYIEALNDNIGLRGSSNQRVIHLTERYADSSVFEDKRGRKCRFITENGKMYMAGVPSRSSAVLVSGLKSAGKKAQNDMV